MSLCRAKAISRAWPYKEEPLPSVLSKLLILLCPPHPRVLPSSCLFTEALLNYKPAPRGQPAGHLALCVLRDLSSHLNIKGKLSQEADLLL